METVQSKLKTYDTDWEHAGLKTLNFYRSKTYFTRDFWF